MACNQHVAGVCWGLAKFYDSFSAQRLADKAVDMGCPRALIVLAMQTHAAPHILSARECVTEPIYAPSRSVLAGDAQPVELSRVMLYELLEAMHVQHPRAAPRQCADDLAQQAVARDHEELYTSPPARGFCVGGRLARPRAVHI